MGLGALAGLAVSGWIGGTLGTVIGGMVAGAITGALVGAAVGGITAAITGGDIMSGVLTGAIGGAIGGAVIGAFNPAAFGVGAEEVVTEVGKGVVGTVKEGATTMWDKVTTGIGEMFGGGIQGAEGAGGGFFEFGKDVMMKGGEAMLGYILSPDAPDQETLRQQAIEDREDVQAHQLSMQSNAPGSQQLASTLARNAHEWKTFMRQLDEEEAARDRQRKGYVSLQTRSGKLKKKVDTGYEPPEYLKKPDGDATNLKKEFKPEDVEKPQTNEMNEGL